jgi:hypothetical protein
MINRNMSELWQIVCKTVGYNFNVSACTVHVPLCELFILIGHELSSVPIHDRDKIFAFFVIICSLICTTSILFSDRSLYVSLYESSA